MLNLSFKPTFLKIVTTVHMYEIQIFDRNYNSRFVICYLPNENDPFVIITTITIEVMTRTIPSVTADIITTSENINTGPSDMSIVC